MPVLARLGEHGGQRFRRVGNDRDRRGFLRDEILNDLDLLLRADVVAALGAGVVAVLLAPFGDADIHSVEPGDALDLDDGDHRLVRSARISGRGSRISGAGRADRAACCHRDGRKAGERGVGQLRHFHFITPS